MAPTIEESEFGLADELNQDEAYFDSAGPPRRTFDASLLKEPLTLVPTRPPLTLGAERSVKEGMQAMQHYTEVKNIYFETE